MIEQRPIDRILRTALVLFMLISIALLVRHGSRLHDREQEVTRLALERTQQMLGIRLEAMFHEWSEDLHEEAEAASTMDTLCNNTLLHRWMPLIDSHYAIMSIRLGDERGNETAVYRKDSSLYLIATEQGSKNGPPTATRILGDGVLDTVPEPWTSQTGYDPRERAWFSKALESERETSVWSLRQCEDSVSTVLQLSYLIRGARFDEPFRVIMFDVDLARSRALDSHATDAGRGGVMLLTGDGRVLVAPSARRGPDLPLVAEQLRTEWADNKQKRYFDIAVNGRSFVARVEPYLLNGLTLQSCVMLDSAPLDSWTALDRNTAWTTSIMFALLGIILTGFWWRGRKRGEQVRKLFKQNKAQARRLDKVIGEREVLSREVHHRVKNNLQVVSSLLNLQASSLADGPVREEFLRGKRRIDTIALVHHKLYSLADLRNVDLSVILNQLATALAEMHRPQSRTVSTSVDSDGIKCDQDTAIELGIIVCELVSNAYQHAFPYATGGHVSITVRNVEGDLHRLVVHNNGVPLPTGYNEGPGKLGLEIVDALAGQLDGSFHARTNGGVTFEVLFRMRRTTATTDLMGTETEDPE